MFHDLDDPVGPAPSTSEQRVATMARGAKLRRRRRFIQTALPAGVALAAVAMVALINPPSIDGAQLPAGPSPSGGAVSEPLILSQGLFYGVNVMSPDGSNSVSVVGWGLDPDWSPDGRRITFEGNGEQPGIWVADADGSNQVRVLPEGVDPAWSRDGSSIAFVTIVEDKYALRAVDLASGSLRTVAVGKGDEHFDNPRWSPDGRSLVFGIGDWNRSTSIPGEGSVIAVVRADGTQPGLPSIITDPSEQASYPDWSPTEDLIVYSTYHAVGNTDQSCGYDCSTFDLPQNLYTVRPDGSDKQQLTTFDKDGPSASEPTWTPDGQRVSFTLLVYASNEPRLGFDNGTRRFPQSARTAFVDAAGDNLTIFGSANPPTQDGIPLEAVRGPRLQPTP